MTKSPSNLLDILPSNAHWSTRRRIAILARYPPSQQLEALLDAANGKPLKLKEMNVVVDLIKLEIPKT